jgi:hypothetical protein
MCYDNSCIVMKVLIDIPDAKAPSLLEVLRHILTTQLPSIHKNMD